VRGKKAKQLRVDRTAEREALRRKQRQQTLFTVIVIAIIIGIGGVLVAITINEERDLAANPSETPSAAPDDRPVACNGEKPADVGAEKPTFEKAEDVLEEGKDYGAVITTTCGKVTVDLDEERAPETVNNFVFLAEEGFFDSLEIFRNATSIGALQTGSGTNDASWDIGYTIKDELDAGKEDGYAPGTLAMANAGADTGGSQFFFVYNDAFTLPADYAAFGVANDQGIKVLEKIGEVPVVAPDAEPGNPDAEKPSETTYIESVTITTK
jgi:cyclophilin family peptidyl-prolyl cis-trans isomerase